MDTGKETHVVTCFLRHRSDILLLRRSEDVRTYAGRWGGVSGYVETDDPEQDARREIDEETGLLNAVELVRQGEAFTLDDDDLQSRWVVHPFLFDSTSRDVRTNLEHTEVAWMAPTDMLCRDTVPALWRSYGQVAPTVASIAADRIHGASWLSVRALEVLRDLADGLAYLEETDGDDLKDMGRQLLAARPSMAAVANRVNRVMHATRPTFSPPAVARAAEAGLKRAWTVDEEVARRAATFAADRRVFTLSRSGTVWEVLHRADPPPTHLVIAASHPGGEGVSVAESLARNGVNVTLVPDAAVAQVFARGLVDVVLVGADAVLRSGAIVNKVGTFPVALAARQHNVPCYAVAATDKVVPGPDEPPLEDAPESDVYRGDAPLEVWAPLFEVIPAPLISGVITEDGVLSRSEVLDVAYELESLTTW